MQTVCQNCGASIEIPYILLGASIECLCGKRTIPKVSVGTRYPYTGYEITFADFQRMLSDTADRAFVIPLLHRWFGYELEVSGDVVRIRTANGEEVDSLQLHQRIQEDGSKQEILYQMVMSLWR